MKSKLVCLFLFLFIITLIGCTTQKNQMGRKGGGGPRGKGQSMYRGGMSPYSKEAFLEVKGKITAIKKVYNRHMGEEGLHLYLQTKDEKYLVHVAPMWVNEKQKFLFQEGEEIMVKGAEFKKQGEPNIYAATILRYSSSAPKGHKTIYLRNPETGDPLWRGRYRK